MFTKNELEYLFAIISYHLKAVQNTAMGNDVEFLEKVEIVKNKLKSELLNIDQQEDAERNK